MRNRRYLLAPVPEIYVAKALLSQAAEAHLEGDEALAASLISEADIPIVRSWTEALWGKTDPLIHQVREVENPAPNLPKDRRVPVRMPNAAECRAMIDRDGYHCRYCGIPVIDAKIRKLLHEIYPETLPWGPRNVDQHAAFQCMWLQYDHITPHSRGGDNGLENMAITCAPCNFGRADYTLEELGLEHPLSHGPVQSDWDGLNRLLH